MGIAEHQLICVDNRTHGFFTRARRFLDAIFTFNGIQTSSGRFNRPDSPGMHPILGRLETQLDQ